MNAQTLEIMAHEYLTHKTRMEELRDELIAAVVEDGFVPERAQKSRRLESAGHVLTVSSSTHTEVNEAAVLKVRQFIRNNAVMDNRWFAKLFDVREVFSIAEGAEEAVQGFGVRAQNLFRRAITVKTTSPRLKVEAKQ